MKICITCEGVSDTDDDRCVHCATRLIDTTTVHYPARRGEADAGNPWIGRVVAGKYRLLEVLGVGGMGTVFSAVHEVSLVQVALKLLNPGLAARAEYRTWFLAEARKAGQVAHENSARILDVGRAQDGTVYIAVELVAGVTLHEWIRSERLRDPALIADILEQMAKALAAAHEASVVHRDLSPRNVMIAVRDGRPFVKILDFGIAKGAPQSIAMRAAASGSHSAGPVGFASPPFSAPEHLEGKEVDGRADLYSLGVVAYQALSGRLPVDGETQEELVQATREGRTRRLPPLPGVPARFARLVDSLLARDPEQRPASATEVAETLSRIRTESSGGLRTFSTSSLIVAVFAFALSLALTMPGPAYLAVAPGKFNFWQTPDQGLETQEIQSAHFAETVFDYGGFDSRRLRVEVSRAGELLEDLDLGSALSEERGELRLSPAGKQRILESLRELSRDGAVDLKFVVEGLQPLGYARVRIDDDPPIVELTDPENSFNMTGKTTLRLRIDDSGPLERVELSGLRGRAAAGTSPPIRIDATEPGTLDLEMAAVLSASPEFAGCAPFPRMRFRVAVEDAAGNVGASAPLLFDAVDLRAPKIASVDSPRGEPRLTYDSDGALVYVRLDALEPGLAVEVHGPSGTIGASIERADSQNRIELTLAPVAGRERPFEDGSYEFIVRDPLGNESEPYQRNLEFQSIAPEPSIRVASSVEGGPVRFLPYDGQYLWDGEPIVLAFSCNSLYQAQSVELRPSGTATLAFAEGPRPWISLPSLPDGEHTLVVSILDPWNDDKSEHPFALRSLKSPPELRLPDPEGALFLKELVDRSVVRYDPDERRIRQGRWNLRPDDARLIRGRFWVGGDDQLHPLEIPEAGSADGQLLRPFEPRNGLTRIAAELHDLLGRPVRVFHGGRPGREFPGPGGVMLQEVARFLHAEAPVEAVDSIVRLEFGQPAELALRFAFTVREGASPELLVGGEPVAAHEVKRSADGTELVFRLPFDQIRGAANLRAQTAEDFAEGLQRPLAVRLRTAAGVFPIQLEVHTIRTGLRPLRLGDLPGALTSASATLRDIAMVPVIGPIGAEFGDPVPPGTSRRRAFRTTPPGLVVRNLPDFFLQRGEVTREQYQAVVESILAMPKSRIEALSGTLVHAFDPLGPARLSRANLVPRAFEDHPARWRDAVESAPKRSVTGIDYFQAHTFARAVGLLVGDDADLCRLPLGVELELAALGARSDSDPVALNGASRSGAGVSFDAFQRAATSMDSLRAWPPTCEESEQHGDLVETELQHEFVGLDFGVREWVLDLPYTESRAESRGLLAEWLADHARHVEVAEQLAATGDLEVMPDDLRASFRLTGVVRGLALGERGGLIDGLTGSRIVPGDGALPATVPGVVRSLHLRRDGAGLVPSESDPKLPRVGLRLSGGRPFVERVRRR